MNRPAFALALMLTATACARSEEASLLPADTNGSTRIAEQVRPERDDQEPALGAWRETLQDERRALEFGPAGAPPLFSLACDPRRALLLQRHGLEASGDLPVMLVSIGSETRRLAVAAGEGPLPMLRATLNSSDTLAGLLSRATTPIAIRIGDSPPLILPPGPAIGTYVTQCSTGAVPAPASAAAPATANASVAVNEAGAAD